MADQSAAPTIANYQILCELGRGTTGVVYKARDIVLNNRLVALKVLPYAQSESALQVKRFVLESQVLAKLGGSGTNIPKIYSVASEQGILFCAREFIDGSTLEQMAVDGSLKLREGIAILATVANEVQRIHAHGIAHRNLHPSNILVDPGNKPKLIGFGRLGFLTGSDVLAPGAKGVPVETDIQALHQMLDWFCGTLRQSIPTNLDAIRQYRSAPNAAEFAAALSSCLESGVDP